MRERPVDVKAIFAEALEKGTPEEQRAYLDQVCGEDAGLRAEVERLLDAHDKAGGFLEGPPVDQNVTLDMPPAVEGPGTKIGRYEVLELIGEGGMGLVYLAEQKRPVKRRVALKIVKPGMDSKHVIARFEAERQALALLDHPNIAHVFDAGATSTGRPYFVMEYVKGMTITRYCDERKLSIEQRLRLFEQICEGIHHAHQKGVIHRDIKPSNILVTVHGDRAVPKIIDFGIAKAITQPLTGKTFVTYQGQLLGTPEYMSPEQVDMATQDIDTRSDIYSLGVLLYELLAGVLPFEDKAFDRIGFAEIQRTIRETEPVSPSTRLTGLGEEAKTIAASRGTQVLALARRLHRELEWIPLKAMRKDRCRRYRSASEMADDVRNYLNGLPLIAGPETVAYRTRKFVRKHAGSVATIALVTVVIILGFVVSTTMYFRSEEALRMEAIALAQAENARAQEAAARIRAEQAEKRATDRAEDYRRALYFNHIALADAAYHDGSVRRLRELLNSCPEDLRGWEWHRLNYVSDQSRTTLRGHESSIECVVFSPDGQNILSGSSDNTLRLWHTVTGEQLMTLRGHTSRVVSCAFSPDGRFIVSGGWGDNTIRVWDVSTGKEAKTLRGDGQYVVLVKFSPDGRRIISSTTDGTVKTWDAESGIELMTLRRDGERVLSVAVSPDGRRIASAGRNRTITVWDATTGAERMALQGHEANITCVEFSADSKCIISGDREGIIKVWNAETGKQMKTMRGHNAWINSVSFSPDGEQIASSARDCTVKVWDAESGVELMILRGHEAWVRSTGFSPDGKWIVSGSADATIKVWDATIDREAQALIGHEDNVLSVAFSPDGKRIVSGSGDKTIKVWDIETGSEVITLLGHRHQVPSRPYVPVAVAFSPDGKWIVTGAFDQTIKVCDATSGAEIRTLTGHEGEVASVAISADSKRLVSASYDKTLRLWDMADGVELNRLEAHDGEVVCVAFSPDGKFIVSGSWDKTIKVWDSETGSELKTLDCKGTWPDCVSVSPDSMRIIAGCGDGAIKIWSAETGVEERVFQGHWEAVVSIAVSHDGRRIISGSFDGSVKVWDSGTGTELLTLHKEGGANSIAISPDGKTIATGGDDDKVKLWECGQPLGGYAQRRTATAARRVVDELYERCAVYHEVIDEIIADDTLDDPLRAAALQIAESRLWEDDASLNK